MHCGIGIGIGIVALYRKALLVFLSLLAASPSLIKASKHDVFVTLNIIINIITQ